MAYQGRQPGVGVRNRFIYSATNGQTSFSGADSNGLTLAYADATYVDVFLNGDASRSRNGLRGHN